MSKIGYVWIIGIMILLVVAGCKAPGEVSNPKLPNIPKPDDMRFCQSDEDCAITFQRGDSCCSTCPYAVSKEAATYLEGWHGLNCGANSLKGCWSYECIPISNLRCENNECTLDRERP